jgi:two-component system sensor histidine kinase GlrK
MQRYYPRSFQKLLVIGFSLVALPLIFALINNAVSVDRIANRSQLAVHQAVLATQASHRLGEILNTMERTARQIVILGDQSMLGAYDIARQNLARTAVQFSRLPFDGRQKAALDEIMRSEAEIYAVLSNAGAKPQQLREAIERFGDLAASARTITARSNALINHEVETMRETAARAQQLTYWQLLALIPVVVFLVVGFSMLISRPIAQIDAAIRRLGKGQFAVPVSVSGPQDLEQLGERLEWMRRELIDIDEEKNRFLRQVSHELKTPLTALREGAELLSEEAVGKLTPEQREIAEILRHNSVELQKLIEDLLSFGASQFRKVTVDLEPVDIGQVIERVAADQRLAMKSRSISLEVNATDVLLSADAEKLRIVMDNLLSNAVKFSPEGGRVRVGASIDGGATLQIDVIDDGPGIPTAERGRIFDPFYQGSYAGNGTVRGTGIGLSVVKEYVFAHGGSVELMDRSRGSHFRVRLPLTRIEADVEAAA